VRVQITERHCEIPSETRQRAEAQIASLAKYSPRASAADVVFVGEKLDRVVEIIVHIDGGDPIVARASDADFRSALDKAVDRLGRRLRKQRERRTDHQAPPRRGRVGRQ
jgi:ribosomal subunit interface protein